MELNQNVKYCGELPPDPAPAGKSDLDELNCSTDSLICHL